MEKLKVIIIDDEMLIRKLIRMKMDLEGLHLELAGEYQDGADAIAHLQEVRPDIIISDICMPEVDGLSFSEACLKIFPDMKIIILTGYDDFDYARRGIKAGVFDYLMKPVRADELNDTLQRASGEILQIREQTRKQKKLLEEMQRNLPALRDIYLNQALLQEQPDPDMEDTLKTYGIRIHPEPDGIQLGMIAIRESIAKLDLTEQILCEAKSFFQSDTDILVFRDHWNRIVAISGKADLPFAECLDILTSIIQQKFQCHFSLGLSGRYSGWAFLHQAYIAALDDMQKKHGTRTQALSTPKSWNRLTELMQNGLAEQALALARQIFSDTDLPASELLKTCIHSFPKLYLDLDINPASVQFDKALKWCCTTEQLSRCVSGIITELTVRKKAALSYRYSELITQALSYMTAHMQNEALNLNLLADEFSVSSGYLSRLIKQYTGRNYGELISDIRFLKMLELMNTTDRKDCEIGVQIGIHDAHYLSIWFKKMSGCSVTEYRKAIQQKAK